MQKSATTKIFFPIGKLKIHSSGFLMDKNKGLTIWQAPYSYSIINRFLFGFDDDTTVVRIRVQLINTTLAFNNQVVTANAQLNQLISYTVGTIFT